MPLSIAVARAVLFVACAAMLSPGCGQDDSPVNTGGSDDQSTSGYVVNFRYQFRSTKAGFEVSSNGGKYAPFWPIGVNFSLATPGHSPGEYLATRGQIMRWLETAGELGANVVRTYTVQSPEFYQELRKYNLDHQQKPLFLIQGATLLDPSDDPELVADPNYLHAKVAAFLKDDIEKAVDAAHGQRVIPPGDKAHPGNFGRAYGTYNADLAPWLFGYVIGRELNPQYVEATKKKPENTAAALYHYAEGKFVALPNGEVIDVFAAKHLDLLVTYELAHYAAQHPVAWLNWPTTDPLKHYTEQPSPASYEDAFALNLNGLEARGAFTAGIFMAYHTFPYYPDFMLYQPEYAVATDADGPNPYLGYLQDLRKIHPNFALLVAETGVPSSQGCAHFAQSGMNHGGFNELQQGWANLRALRTVAQAGANGALLSGMIDEWYRKTWLTAPLTLPAGRQQFWFNAASADQQFGLVAFDPGAPGKAHQIDGDDADWAGLKPNATKTFPLLSPRGDGFDAMRTLKDVTIHSDAGYLHVRLRVESLDPDGDGKVQWDRVDYAVLIDTIDPFRGDSRLDPDGKLQTERRVEFQVRIHSATDVQLLVDRPYDMVGAGQVREPWQKYRSVTNDDGQFNLLQARTNGTYTWHKETATGTDFLPLAGDKAQETGRLRTGPQSQESGSNFWFNVASNTLELRIPWQWLNVTDPSQRWVIEDEGKITGQIGTAATPGFGIAVASYGGEGEAEISVTDTLPLATQTVANDGKSKAWLIPAKGTIDYSWATWDTPPPVTERRKKSFVVLRDNLPTVLPPTAFAALP